MASVDYLGTGIAFPFSIKDGKIQTASGEQLVEQSIRIILGTMLGERVMRPDFGSNLHTLTFGINSSSTTTLLTHFIRETLEQWEPRIELLDVKSFPDPQKQGQLNIHIDYEIRASNSKRNMVYPFYLEGSR